MRKYLMNGMAAVALCAAFVSCSHDDFEPMTQAQIDKAKYDQTFINYVGGSISSNQNWGFGSTATSRMTRSIGDEITVGSTVSSTNKTKGYSGWNDEKTYVTVTQSEYGYAYATDNINVAAAAFAKGYQDLFTEGSDNREVLLNYSSDEFVTTAAGELSYVVVKAVTSDWTDRVGYYYYTGEGDVKTLHKYVISNELLGTLYNTDWSNYVDGVQVPIFKFKQFKLVYFDENGNPSYTFPAGLKVGFFCETSKLLGEAAELYSTGSLNKDISEALGAKTYDANWTKDNNATSSHVAIYAKDGVNYIGFEDWNDFDYNDIVLSVVGNVKPSRDIDNEELVYDLRIIAEDLSASDDGDFDFNDVVFDVKYDTDNAYIKLLAAGGQLKLRIDEKDEWEVHTLFNVAQNYMVNTNAKAKKLTGSEGKNEKTPVEFRLGRGINNAAEANSIKIEVFKNNEWQELTAVKGEPAAKLAVGTDYNWLEERTSIKATYSKFVEWAKENHFESEWWKTAVAE